MGTQEKYRSVMHMERLLQEKERQEKEHYLRMMMIQPSGMWIEEEETAPLKTTTSVTIYTQNKLLLLLENRQ